MSIEVRLLRPFLVTARRLSFTKAADELGISQPRLSFLIKKLEDQVGFQLFVRVPHQVRLSREGSQFLEYAEEIGNALSHFDHSISDLRGNVGTRIRFGSPISTTMRYPRRYELLDEFVTRHPSVRLKYENGLSNALVDRLREGKIDLTLSMMPFDPTGIGSLLMESSRVFVAIPKENPLSKKAEIAPQMLRGEKVAVTPLGASVPSYLTLSLTMLHEAGAIPVEAYEPQHGLQLYFAFRKRMCAIIHKWQGDMPDPDIGYTDMVFRPLVGADVSMKVHLLKLTGPQPLAVEWFWKIARRMSDQPDRAEA